MRSTTARRLHLVPLIADLRDLSDADLALISHARDILDRNGDGAVSTMGSTFCSTTGEIFGASNLYHFTGVPCAELVVLGLVSAQGSHSLETIAAVGDGGRRPVGPAADATSCSSTITPRIVYCF